MLLPSVVRGNGRWLNLGKLVMHTHLLVSLSDALVRHAAAPN